MQYLIIHREERYYTDWYSYENNYIKGMIVIDLMNDKISIDGETWIKIQYDHL